MDRRGTLARSLARLATAARWARLAVLVAAAGVPAACFQYSPHDLPEDRGLHARALEDLARHPATLPFRFAVVGDVQQVFSEAEDCVEALRRIPDLAFVVQAGDFTHMGLTFEFEAMARIFGRLHVPWFVAVGNHDLVANGRAIFEHLFGPTDLAFTHGGVRFVLMDTNGLEASFAPDVPDLAWLGAQLEQADGDDGGDTGGGEDGAGDDDPSARAIESAPYRRVVVFSHVAATDPEFNPELAAPFLGALRDAGAVAFHAHAHAYRVWQEDGVQMYGADYVKFRNYLLVTVSRDRVEVERVFF